MKRTDLHTGMLRFLIFALAIGGQAAFVKLSAAQSPTQAGPKSETVALPTDPSAQDGAAEVSSDSTDSTNGAIAERNLIMIIQQGGLLLYPILISSFILVLFLFERLFSLRRRRVIPKPFVRQFLHQLRENSIDQDEALEMCCDNGSPVATVFAGAVQKWGRPAVEVEQGIIDSGERVTNGLRRYLRLINGIATVTPLLGLLGTVVGMIQAFNDIATADAMGKPELLAAGIGQALITTAGGLTVAIPALIATCSSSAESIVSSWTSTHWLRKLSPKFPPKRKANREKRPGRKLPRKYLNT